MFKKFFTTFLLIFYLSYIDFTFYFWLAHHTNKIGYGNYALVLQFGICAIIGLFTVFFDNKQKIVYISAIFTSIVFSWIFWGISEATFLRHLLKLLPK